MSSTEEENGDPKDAIPLASVQLPESSVAFIYQEKGQRCDSENEEVSIEEHDDHEGQVLLGDLAGHEEEAREHDSHQGGVEGDSSESITAAAASGRSRNSGSCNGNGSRRKRSGEGGDTGGNTGNAAAIQAIKNGLLMIPVDLEELRNFAWKEGGYQTGELRMKVWPKLLGLDRHGMEDFKRHLDMPHPMSEQIQRDIDRSLTHFLHVRKWKRHRQQSKREKLGDVINAIVKKYDGVLNYYQGYHDVVTMLLLVTGDTQLTFALTERASHYFFRDCMRADFEVLTYLMHLIPVIMKEFDPQLAAFVSKAKVEPYYSMPWVITWFAHDLQDFHSVARLYDVLLGAHASLILYICVAVAISARDTVLACECEFSAVHNALSQAAKKVEDWEAILQKSKGMFIKRPPNELVNRAPAYIKETIYAGGITSLEFPPPWFTGTSLPDWILLGNSREKEGKRRICKAARQWRRAARLAGADNPDEMLVTYLEGGREKDLGGFLNKILKKVKKGPRKWKITPSPTTLISTAVLIGAVSFSYHVSSWQQLGFPP